MALAEKSGTAITPGVVDDESSNGENPVQQQPEQEKLPARNSALDGNTTAMIFVGIAVAAVGGIGFYLKIVKPKKHGRNNGDDEFDEYEDSGDEDYIPDDAE